MADEGVTGAAAGLSADDQIRAALREMVAHDGTATMPQIYAAVETLLGGRSLSEQGRASLRRLVNTIAVQAGYIYPHDASRPGWHITPEGRDALGVPQEPVEDVLNVDTAQSETVPLQVARSAAFERYIMMVMQAMHPHYAWYHQGIHKQRERGLDLIGTRVDINPDEPGSIGVQVKLHQERYAPSAMEWLKFLAGCYVRRIDRPIFVTTGHLTGEQHREAGEARVVVMEGEPEITRLAHLYLVAKWDLYGDR
ncbi:MAG TPA: restriction endonuclease [Ktedonobacterales bacterium]